MFGFHFVRKGCVWSSKITFFHQFFDICVRRCKLAVLHKFLTLGLNFVRKGDAVRKKNRITVVRASETHELRRGSRFANRFFPRASERRVLPIVGVCKTSSHLHIFSSSHLLILTSSPHPSSSHLHIFSSSHLLIFTPSHLHIFSSSHLLILTSSPHLLIFTSSRLLIFSSSHLLIFTSSHLHIFSSSHLLTSSHIFSHLLTSSHIFSPLLTSSHIFSHLLTSSHIFSHLLTSSHIFSHLHSHLLTSSHIFSHLLIFTSSHLTSSPLALLPSYPLALLPSCPLLLFYFSFEGGSRGSANETARNATLSHEMRVDRQKLR